MEIYPIRSDLKDVLHKYKLVKKWGKVSHLFTQNIRHPSLHTELLEPHWRAIYSFRGVLWHLQKLQKPYVKQD